MRRTDAHLRRPLWFYAGVALVGGLPMAMVACGSDDDGSSNGNTTNDSGGTAGTGGGAGADGGTDAGGSSNGGSANTTSGGNGGDAGGGGDPSTGGNAGETSSGGSSTTGGEGGTAGNPVATIDDVVGAVCDWEFRCCDAGELTYREIHEATGVSTTTIVRVARFLRQENNGGYRILLDRTGVRK